MNARKPTSHDQPDLLKYFAKDDAKSRLEALRILTSPARLKAWALVVTACGSAGVVLLLRHLLL